MKSSTHWYHVLRVFRARRSTSQRKAGGRLLEGGLSGEHFSRGFATCARLGDELLQARMYSYIAYASRPKGRQLSLMRDPSRLELDLRATTNATCDRVCFSKNNKTQVAYMLKSLQWCSSARKVGSIRCLPNSACMMNRSHFRSVGSTKGHHSSILDLKDTSNSQVATLRSPRLNTQVQHVEQLQFEHFQTVLHDDR